MTQKCFNCGGSGHYEPAHPHCEPCECEWACWYCRGTGEKPSGYGRYGDATVEHRGQNIGLCVGCQTVRTAAVPAAD